ncbi:hypothetical protein CMUS01_13395 [Colletotrichum musicola]|uniref:DUF1754-domain-containing protein n=1 Tax=Colletotrichum musicola TaxID=2175873 RepID=A0A8H6JD59_9PEZI|nr:hypothetical protein CMUS01_13395 [Colletotrichum musicola]
MPLDEYASVGGGLKLKGAKIGKKKKRKDKTDLEKNLDDGNAAGTVARRSEDPAEEDKKRKKKSKSEDPADEDADKEDDAGPVVHKTEAERRHEERKRRRNLANEVCDCEQLLELAESSSARPELLKTHKERVEELNTYLSKLSEHHDMPKIGPG